MSKNPFFTIYNLSGTPNSVSECSQGTVQQCSPKGVQRVSKVKYVTKNPVDAVSMFEGELDRSIKEMLDDSGKGGNAEK